MKVLEWMCEEPSRVLITTILSFVVFSLFQLILSIKAKTKFSRLILVLLTSLLSIVEITFAFRLISGQSEGIDNLQWLVAVLAGTPLVFAWIGILSGWVFSKILIKRFNYHI